MTKSSPQRKLKRTIMKAKVQTKEVEFDAIEEGKVEIRKLSLKAVKALQEMGKTIEDTNDFESNLDAIKTVIRASVIGAEEMSDEDFEEFAIADLADLQQMIMDYSGLGVSNAAPVEGND